MKRISYDDEDNIKVDLKK